jgi:DMSO/TMAO reductase YedYZ molybdopterin-dependent catalytic subunit
MTRRDLLKAGFATAAAGLTLPLWKAFALPPAKPGEELVPFLNMPRTPPNRLDWEMLQDWLTPQDQVFGVQHYGIPEFDESKFRLEITGLVNKPMTFTMEQLRARAKKDQLMTLECSGNGSSPGFMNAVYNSKWTGTLLAPILKECGIKPGAKEIVFFGKDKQEELLRPATKRELKVEVPFGRSMSVDDALSENLMLAYDRNGAPLLKANGAPLRLIVPGWYGVANVKWLTRIDVRNRRYMGKYMGRDYVTVRGERRADGIEYVESSVTRIRLKSVIGRVTRQPAQNGQIPLRAIGAAWNDGTEITKVEVKVDGGEWRSAVLDKTPHEKFCWRFFSIDLGNLAPGKHTLVSRAFDAAGHVQPAAEDDEIALKKTYWEAYQQWPREIELA